MEPRRNTDVGASLLNVIAILLTYAEGGPQVESHAA